MVKKLSILWIIIIILLLFVYNHEFEVPVKESDMQYSSFDIASNITKNEYSYATSIDQTTGEEMIYLNNSGVFISEIQLPESIYAGQQFNVNITVTNTNITNFTIFTECSLFYPHTFEPDGGYVGLGRSNSINIESNSSIKFTLLCESPKSFAYQNDPGWGIDPGENQLSLRAVNYDWSPQFSYVHPTIDISLSDRPATMKVLICSALLVGGIVISSIIYIKHRRNKFNRSEQGVGEGTSQGPAQERKGGDRDHPESGTTP